MTDIKSVFKKIFAQPEKQCCCKVKISRAENKKESQNKKSSEAQKAISEK